MQEIQINESAPRHTKALVVISLVVIVVLAFTLAYFFLFSSGMLFSPQENISKISNLDILFSGQQVNTEQQTDETLPQLVRGLLGKWKGEWVFTDAQKLPAGIVISTVTESGWRVAYANTVLSSAEITAMEGTTTATPALFKDGGENITAMQMTLPGFKGEGIVTMVFWLSETADTLFGRFTDPVTQEVVTGEFKRLP